MRAYFKLSLRMNTIEHNGEEYETRDQYDVEEFTGETLEEVLESCFKRYGKPEEVTDNILFWEPEETDRAHYFEELVGYITVVIETEANYEAIKKAVGL